MMSFLTDFSIFFNTLCCNRDCICLLSGTGQFVNFEGLFLTFLVPSLYFFVKKRHGILSVATFCVLYIQYV